MFGSFLPWSYNNQEKAKALKEWEELKAEELKEIQGTCQPQDISNVTSVAP